MLVHETLCYPESETSPFLFSREEGLEQFASVLRMDSRPIVSDYHPHSGNPALPVRRVKRMKPQPPSAHSDCFHRVHEQICENLPKFSRKPIHFYSRSIQLIHRYFLVPNLVSVEIQHFVQNTGKVNPDPL